MLKTAENAWPTFLEWQAFTKEQSAGGGREDQSHSTIPRTRLRIRTVKGTHRFVLYKDELHHSGTGDARSTNHRFAHIPRPKTPEIAEGNFSTKRHESARGHSMVDEVVSAIANMIVRQCDCPADTDRVVPLVSGSIIVLR